MHTNYGHGSPIPPMIQSHPSLNELISLDGHNINGGSPPTVSYVAIRIPQPSLATSICGPLAQQPLNQMENFYLRGNWFFSTQPQARSVPYGPPLYMIPPPPSRKYYLL